MTFVDRYKAMPSIGHNCDFASVEFPGWVKCALYSTECRIETWAKELRSIFTAKSRAMLAPQDATVTPYQFCHFITDATQAYFIIRVTHVERRPDVKTADINMPKHSVV